MTELIIILIIILLAVIIFLVIKKSLTSSRVIKKADKVKKKADKVNKKRAKIQEENHATVADINNSPGVDHGVLPVKSRGKHNHTHSEPCGPDCPLYVGD